MGFEVTRFEEEVDEDLVCPICSGVLEEPLQATQCEHAFCSRCINDWLDRQSTCPIDRGALTHRQLKPVPRILKNLLARLKIRCSNCLLGCESIVKLESLNSHLNECDFNPKKPVVCDKGCSLTMPKDELPNHNCVKELRVLLNGQQTKINCMQAEAAEMRSQQIELRRELQLIKVSMNSYIVNRPQENVLSLEDEEIRMWAGALGVGRVTRWGGMISTPDTVLQTVMKRALIDSACPQHIVNDLMDHSHERRWPPGLCTLEARQNNRRLYDLYVCKRIPGKQAVVVMAHENTHMSEDMILVPGLVMIFAHGVE